MSEYSFGYDPSDDESGLGETENQQGPKWFREGLAKLSGQVQELRAENAALKADRVKGQTADALKAKGYDPAAAGLYKGEPEKLDEWLGTYGAALARVAGEGQQPQGEEVPSGPPTSAVPADGQAQMQRMLEQGTQGVAPPQGSDKEVAAALAAANSEDEFKQLMKSHGNPYDWGS